MTESALVNGEPRAALALSDRGLHYGDGLFETIAVRAGKPLRWERHLERLARGARRLGIPLPPAALLAEEAGRLTAGAGRAVLKIILTRGAGGRGYAPPATPAPTRILRLSAWPDRPAAFGEQGVAVRLCRTRLGRNPALAGIKHLNRLEQVLARSEWQDEFAEGLMCDETGAVIEGTMTNIFAVLDGVLCTPDLSACGVEGVVRAEVLALAAELALPVATRVLALADLARAQEAFLTNSLIGIWPVALINCTASGAPDIRYTVGPITRRLQEKVIHA